MNGNGYLQPVSLRHHPYKQYLSKASVYWGICPCKMQARTSVISGYCCCWCYCCYNHWSVTQDTWHLELIKNKLGWWLQKGTDFDIDGMASIKLFLRLCVSVDSGWLIFFCYKWMNLSTATLWLFSSFLTGSALRFQKCSKIHWKLVQNQDK